MGREVIVIVIGMQNDSKKIIIEAVWGLGEFIVQGTVNPDHYEIEKKDFKIN